MPDQNNQTEEFNDNYLATASNDSNFTKQPQQGGHTSSSKAPYFHAAPQHKQKYYKYHDKPHYRKKKSQSSWQEKNNPMTNGNVHLQHSSQEEYIPPIRPKDAPITKISDLQQMSAEALAKYAQTMGLEHTISLPKSQIVFEIVKHKSLSCNEILVGEGTLEILSDGFGFLRSKNYNYLASVEDIYVPSAQIKRFGLRKGDEVYGEIRAPREKEKYFALLSPEKINGNPLDRTQDRPFFDNLTPVHPNKRILLETTKDTTPTRILDILAPLGKGQRGLIVSPPKTGKTTILQNIIQAIQKNHPEIHIIILLIDERPEEVTEMKKLVAGQRGEVIASTFDEPPENHCHAAELCIEKAKRIAEYGGDVLIMLDSLTRMARAFNARQAPSGRILSGGIDANALPRPKRFFGAARSLEEGGSLTIIGTALVETESKMDTVIFEEFKGTGNMEIFLDRKIAEKRIFPAIDITKSSTRKEELLFHPDELEKVHILRRELSNLSPSEAILLLSTQLKKTHTNAEFLLTLSG